MAEASGGKRSGNAAGAPPSGGGDAAELSRRVAEIAERSQRLVADFLARQANQGGTAKEGVGMADPGSIGQAFFELTQRMMADPQKLIQAQVALWNDYLNLWQRTAERMMGKPAEPMIAAAPDDRRFRDEAWSSNTLFDFIKQSYLLDRALYPGRGQGDRRARRPHRAQGRFLYAPVRRCDGALELRDDQPGGAARHGRQPRREPGQRPAKPARRPRARQGQADDQHDRHGGVQDRRECRRDAGQGRLPERPHPADPVRAHHRDGAPQAAADHPALDQQVLHPRFAADELVHPLGGEPGAHGVRDLVGQP